MSNSSLKQTTLLIAVLSAFFPFITALPSGKRQHRPRQNDPSSSTFTDLSMQIWLPIIIVVLLGLAICAVCVRRSLRTSAQQRAASSAAGVREVTADQLAGRTQGADGQGTRSRRPRRNRRTPSQISTTSLPAYMKEPGDEELVIFRGPQDMEDASLMPTAVMPPVEEQDAEDSLHSRTGSQTSTYAAVPVTSNATPLLRNSQSQDRAGTSLTQNQIPPTQSDQRSVGESFDTSSSSAGANSEAVVDPRGEVPPYFEVPLPTDAGTVPHATAPVIAIASSPPTNDNAGTSVQERRRSGFRTFLNSLSNPTSRTPAQPPSSDNHARSDSAVSGGDLSSNIPHSLNTSQARTSHRPSTSGGSGSVLNISPFRPISRQRSNNTLNSNRMNSPSLISLNSISAPLTHTLVRTEFTYPKSGPTPEQLRLISSRDSLARFGMPYGPDAIAYAASASRHEIHPPPDFDAPSSGVPSLPPSLQTPDTPRPEAVLSQPVAEQTVPTVELPADADTNITTADHKENEPVETAESADPAVTLPPTSPTTIPPPPSVSPAIPTTAMTTPVPPSSFRFPANMARSASRASSLMSIGTYATAAESMGTSGTDSEPTTPLPSEVQSRHVHEGTDVTITP